MVPKKQGHHVLFNYNLQQLKKKRKKYKIYKIIPFEIHCFVNLDTRFNLIRLRLF